jgi:hypothetical protein
VKVLKIAALFTGRRGFESHPRRWIYQSRAFGPARRWM